MNRTEAAAQGLKEFHVAKPCKNGHTLRTTVHKGCVECRRVVQRRYYHDHRKTPQFNVLRRAEDNRRTRENPALRIYQRAKKRAKDAKLPFDLRVADISVPGVCPILGIPLRVGDGKSCDNSPSIDRRIPAAGYVRGNIAIISQRANQIKNSATVAELRAIADWMEKQ